MPCLEVARPITTAPANDTRQPAKSRDGKPSLGEVPPLLVLPGGALCLAGVALARTTSRRSRVAYAAPPAR